MVTGTPSGKNSKGRLVSGRTGGTLGGKESEAAATIKLDLPVPLSPTTTIRTDLGEPGQSTVPAEYLAIWKLHTIIKLEERIRVSDSRFKWIELERSKLDHCVFETN